MKILVVFEDGKERTINISKAIALDWKLRQVCWLDNKKYSINATSFNEMNDNYVLYVSAYNEDTKKKTLDDLLAQDLAEYDSLTVYKKDGLIRTNLFLQAQNDLAIAHFGLPIHQITGYNPPLFEEVDLDTKKDYKDYYNLIADNSLITYCTKFNCDNCPVFLESGYSCADEGSIFQAFDSHFDQADEVSQEIFIDELLQLVDDFNSQINKSIQKIKNKKGKKCF